MKHLPLLVPVFSLLFSSCAPTTQLPTSAITPSISPTSTATTTPFPTLTSIPIPLPQSLLADKKSMEQKGYGFGESEITHLDAQGKEWEVVKFNVDRSAVIKTLDNNYRGSEYTVSAEEAAGIHLMSLNAGHDQVLTITNPDTGKVEKMFLPNIDNNKVTEAGWVTPIKISQDGHNPTKVDSASAFHTRHVLYSALLGRGAEQWPENFPITTIKLDVGGQYNEYFRDKLGLIRLSFYCNDLAGKPVILQGRSLGFIELNTPGGSIINNVIEYKTGNDGRGYTVNIGYSGDLRNQNNFFDYHLVNFRRSLLLFQSLGDDVGVSRGGVEEMPGVHYLYDHDPDNSPSAYFPEEIYFINGLDLTLLQSIGFQNHYENLGKNVTDDPVLDELQDMILYPEF